jgi:hypothetical protein
MIGPFIVGLALVAASGVAHASIQLAIGATTGTLTTRTLTPQGGGLYTYVNAADNIGGILFEIEISITTNSPGTATLAQLITVESSVRQGGAGGGNRDVYIEVLDDTFTMPTGAALVLNSEYTGTLSNQNPTTHLTSEVLVGATVLATVGPHNLNTIGTPDPFSNLATPFTLRNLTYVNLDPNASADTTSETWVSLGSTPPPPNGGVPEPTAIAVWSLIVGLAVGVRRFAR